MIWNIAIPLNDQESAAIPNLHNFELFLHFASGNFRFCIIWNHSTAKNKINKNKGKKQNITNFNFAFALKPFLTEQAHEFKFKK